MNKYERLAYQRKHTKYLGMLLKRRYGENSGNDMVDNYIIDHNKILEDLENNVDVVLTDKQLDAIVEKLVKQIL